ncbi:hypothetical protein CEY16_05025 [Halalkalibacillus sediminis]|uniref:Peptidase M50 domain-containing protein n=1 Tax=Halalkalibacillus sediminis TaxID=2018042 RepID=A0A2I0QXQ7_9BACI|nr:site-2 protease family protein [Halalkalibacillus sediminis]PKR79116.1 hypothetical protein CEY16_05025 [Halalkalibacillus sediminis]
MNKERTIYLHPLLFLMLIASYFLGMFIELFSFLVIVTIHELGHFVAAKYFKWNVRRLVLWPFGGVMETEDFYNRPRKEELIVILAGPIQHVWIAVFLWAMPLSFGEHIMIERLWLINLLVLGFNLIPIMPLDGGRLVFIMMNKWISLYRAIICMSIVSFTIILFGNVIIFIMGYYSIHLSVFSMFLLIDNWMTFQNKFIFLIRHVLNRATFYEKNNDPPHIIEVSSQTSFPEIISRFKMNRYHYIRYQTRGEDSIISEEEFINNYFHDQA